MYHTSLSVARHAAKWAFGIMLTAATVAQGASIHIERDVAYGVGASNAAADGAITLRLDVYHPREPATAPRPAVVLIHGGGFRSLDKTHRHPQRLGRFFAEHGYVAFAIGYRQIDDFPPAPREFQARPVDAAHYAAVSDAKAAVRFIRAEHARFGVDRGKIFAFGSSAGATVALGLALTKPLDWSFYGPGDRFQLQNHPEESPKVCAAVALWGNGTRYLDGLDATTAPVLFVHGRYDPKKDTPFDAAEALAAGLGEAGAPFRFLPVDTKGHTLWDERIEGKSMDALALTFFEEHREDSCANR